MFINYLVQIIAIVASFYLSFRELRQRPISIKRIALPVLIFVCGLISIIVTWRSDITKEKQIVTLQDQVKDIVTPEIRFTPRLSNVFKEDHYESSYLLAIKNVGPIGKIRIIAEAPTITYIDIENVSQPTSLLLGPLLEKGRAIMSIQNAYGKYIVRLESSHEESFKLNYELE